MINDIKMDKFSTQPTNQDVSQQAVPQQAAAQTYPKDGITVTNHLNKLKTILASNTDEMTSNESSAVVNNIKYLIQTNQYKVDLNALSDKLLKSGALSDLSIDG
jgi:anti-sigma28 factor (negative regulator of flagellin synthesis)